MVIEVSVPGLLADCTGGRSRFPLEADTLQEALDRLFAEYPLLKRHVFAENGELRKHVLLCYNEDNLAWLASKDIPLKAGDRLHVLQLVSGG
ncbi:MoaD/ThiS family protein [Paenibacillus sp. HJGM_3]|uniref:MoaD/ThiS family protein n=1 Tax=Paenibacillus sp. HJGM_3 TaxID=3379816 RepID=UPI00385FC3B1